MRGVLKGAVARVDRTTDGDQPTRRVSVQLRNRRITGTALAVRETSRGAETLVHADGRLTWFPTQDLTVIDIRGQRMTQAAPDQDTNHDLVGEGGGPGSTRSRRLPWQTRRAGA
jgi:hypothetical protein